MAAGPRWGRLPRDGGGAWSAHRPRCRLGHRRLRSARPRGTAPRQRPRLHPALRRVDVTLVAACNPHSALARAALGGDRLRLGSRGCGVARVGHDASGRQMGWADGCRGGTCRGAFRAPLADDGRLARHEPVHRRRPRRFSCVAPADEVTGSGSCCWPARWCERRLGSTALDRRDHPIRARRCSRGQRDASTSPCAQPSRWP